MIEVMNATDVRRDWSAVVDNTVRTKPQFFKRTRDYIFLSDLRFMEELLKGYSYSDRPCGKRQGRSGSAREACKSDP